MRVVADTNTAISGLLWDDGNPRRVLIAAAERHITLFSSSELLDELRRLIRASKFAARLVSQRLTVDAAVEHYQALCSVVSPARVMEPRLRDPKDLHVLACARAARANMIASGDEDLLDLKVWQGIPIVRPADVVHSLPRD